MSYTYRGRMPVMSAPVWATHHGYAPARPTWGGNCCCPRSRNFHTYQESDEGGESEGGDNEDKNTICVPLPTEEAGFTSSLCAKVDITKTEQSASIYLRVDGVGQVTLGEIDNSQTQFSVDIGATLSILGIGKGIGGTMQIIENKSSGCISACANIQYVVGTVAPWYTLITCLKPKMT